MKTFAQSVEMRREKKTSGKITGSWLIHGCVSWGKVSVRAWVVFIQ